MSQNAPYMKDEQPGKKAWCACGATKKEPYCDGAHKGTSKAPIVVEFTEAKKVAWCGCGHSKNKPYCDGTHKSLPWTGPS